MRWQLSHAESTGTTERPRLASPSARRGRASCPRFPPAVRTRTPGEIATHAIERDGLPPAAVRTVRDAFRAVEYGQRDPQEHVAAVEDAIRHIETAAGQQSSATDDTDDATEGRP